MNPYATASALNKARHDSIATRPIRSVLCALAILLFLPSWTVRASEGATSLYLPGMVGDILVAIPPEPGLAASSSIYVQSGSVGTAILQGVVDLGLDLDVALFRLRHADSGLVFLDFRASENRDPARPKP